MCGRYSLDENIDALIERYKAMKSMEDFDARDEIFPTNTVPIVVNNNKTEIVAMKWGFTPHFAKRPIINARAETVDEKPLFKHSFINKRCIIPITSFYEWQKVNNEKIKRRISLPNEDIFSVAGLYNDFTDKEGKRTLAFTMITTEANETMKDIHHRMPVIIPKDLENYWLDANIKEILSLKSILKPYKGQMAIV